MYGEPGHDLVNLIRREVGRWMATYSRPKVGKVTSYDPETHTAKVKVLPGTDDDPDGVETGWLPIKNMHIGNGYGVAFAPKVGDQVLVGFQEGDPESPQIEGRYHSDPQKPPKLNEGEMILKHESGSTVFFDENGNLHLKSQGNVYINGSGSTP